MINAAGSANVMARRPALAGSRRGLALCLCLCLCLPQATHAGCAMTLVVESGTGMKEPNHFNTGMFTFASKADVYVHVVSNRGGVARKVCTAPEKTNTESPAWNHKCVIVDKKAWTFSRADVFQNLDFVWLSARAPRPMNERHSCEHYIASH